MQVFVVLYGSENAAMAVRSTLGKSVQFIRNKCADGGGWAEGDWSIEVFELDGGWIAQMPYAEARNRPDAFSRTVSESAPSDHAIPHDNTESRAS